MSTFNRDQHTPRPGRGAHVYERRIAAMPAGAPTLRESRDGWLRDGRRRQLSPDTRQSYRESTDEFLTVVGPQRTADSLTAHRCQSRRHRPLAQIRSMLGRVSLRNQVLLLILLDTGLRIGDAFRMRRTDLCHMQDGQPYFEVAISKTHSGGQAPISVTTERILRRYLRREFPRL